MKCKNLSLALSDALSEYPEEARRAAPLIHCITNYVTANDVANVLLAAGASPLMADHPKETASAASSSDGLVLNLGTLKRGSVTAMIRAGKAAMKKDIPIVFDPVGIGMSAHRRHAAGKILSNVRVSIVRGNSSEIRTLANLFGYPVSSEQHGVDAISGKTVFEETVFEETHSDLAVSEETAPEETLSEQTALEQPVSDLTFFSKRLNADNNIAYFLSKKLNAVIICTGVCDLVVYGRITARIRNGSSELAHITGSGCMMDGLLAAFAAAAHKNHRNDKFHCFYSSVCAVTEIGLCGEKAAELMHEQDKGLGSFHVFFLDAVSCMTGEELSGGQKIEITTK